MSNKPSKAERKAQSARDKARMANPKPQKGKGGKAPRRRSEQAGSLFGRGGDTGQQVHLSWSVIEKDELVVAVNGSVALTATKFAINPGLPGTFPIGAPEAKRWTEWKAAFCEFYFKRTVSEFATQGTTGRVVLACDYSALNDAPASLQAAEALHSKLGMPCTPEILLKLDPSILNKADPKYIRTGQAPAGSDIRLFDGGNLWFVTSGCQNATEIGELRVRYKFLVRLPNLDDTFRLTPTVASQFQSSAAEAGGATTVNAQMLFATAVQNPLAIVNTAGSFVPPAGSYAVSVETTIAPGDSFMTKGELDVWKNGATVFAGAALHPTGGCAANAANRYALSTSVIVVANGTDAFTFQVKQTGSVAGTNWGSLLWTLV